MHYVMSKSDDVVLGVVGLGVVVLGVVVLGVVVLGTQGVFMFSVICLELSMMLEINVHCCTLVYVSFALNVR